MPGAATLEQLQSWTEIEDDRAKAFAGAARYSIEFQAPNLEGVAGWILDLGDVRESARVWLNGRPVGVAVAHPYRMDLGDRIQEGKNRLEIEVTNLSANRIRDLDQRGVDWKKFHDINFVSHLYRPFDASKWDLKPSGLLGPVNLVSYQPKTVDEQKVSTLFLIGDSTVKTGDGNGGNGQWGWGSVIDRHFDSQKVRISNEAVGGLSSRTFLTQGYWKRVLDKIKAGDFVLIQFGHNDGGEKFAGNRPRASIKGNGDETVEGTIESTGQKEVVRSYGWYLRKFISDAHSKGATAIVLSPVPRKKWQAERIQRANNDYALWARQAAEMMDAPFIDLNDIVADRYELLGPRDVEEMFADEHTHTSLAGAELNAECVVSGLLSLSPCELLNGLRLESRRDIPARPDGRPSIYLIGDSTVKNGHGNQVGWGEVIQDYFDTDKINVFNHAIAGRSSRSFHREQRWQEIYEQLRPGDFVIMQFGHNDGGTVGDPRFKRRPSLPGVGGQSQPVSLDDGSGETVHTYGWYLERFCKDCTNKNAIAIVCTPVPHQDNWNDGIFTADFKSHRSWCREVATNCGAHFIDLTARVGDRYQALGQTEVSTLFADARTHTNAAGAEINAECVVMGLKTLKGRPLQPYLRSRQ